MRRKQFSKKFREKLWLDYNKRCAYCGEEIELKDEKQKYEIPDFIEVIGDVTGNIDYSNSSLARKYFTDRKHK